MAASARASRTLVVSARGARGADATTLRFIMANDLRSSIRCDDAYVTVISRLIGVATRSRSTPKSRRIRKWSAIPPSRRTSCVTAVPCATG